MVSGTLILVAFLTFRSFIVFSNFVIAILPIENSAAVELSSTAAEKASVHCVLFYSIVNRYAHTGMVRQMTVDSTGHRWNKTDGENEVMTEKPDRHKSHIYLLSMEPRPLQRTVWQLSA
jgi:hypothetical protein